MIRDHDVLDDYIIVKLFSFFLHCLLCDADMLCRLLEHPLGGIASVINLVILIQIAVADIGPAGTPFFRIGTVIPIGCLHFLAHPLFAVALAEFLLSGLWVNDRDLIPVSIQLVYLLFFLSPASVLLKRTGRKQDMRMWVAVLLIVD